MPRGRDRCETTGVCLLVKMLAVVGVPAITVILLSSLLLVNAVVTYRQSNDAIDELRVFYQVDQLVTNLQVTTRRLTSWTLDYLTFFWVYPVFVSSFLFFAAFYFGFV